LNADVLPSLVVVKPTTYPDVVISDDECKSIGTIITRLSRKLRGDFSIKGVMIKEYKFGVIFMSFGNQKEMDIVMGIGKATCWVNHGLPNLSFIPADDLVSAPVFEAWSPMKGVSFTEVLEDARDRANLNVTAWRLLKKIDIQRNKGVTFVFIGDRNLSDRIREQGVIKFSVGVYSESCQVKIPRGYAGAEGELKIMATKNLINLSFAFRFKLVRTEARHKTLMSRTTSL
jgi:hypothetical protein